ncbi:MAG TPA: hypothetical protein VEL07_18055 [Planctomycetota bacterium]|nr:hypothetical protein [Planctomycetota bacterium]
MRYDVRDLVLSFEHKRVFPLLALDVGDAVDDRGWVYRPVLARIALPIRDLYPAPGFVVHDIVAHRVVLEFHAVRVWRYAHEVELRIEGQALVAAREAGSGADQRMDEAVSAEGDDRR